MSVQERWLTEIGRAADQLGYGISLLEPDRVELYPFKGPNITIEVRGIFLSGDVLRKYLRDYQGEKEKEA